MRIVIKNEGNSKEEVTLRGDRITVGHSRECQLWLDKNQWPMVAELHAELRSVSGVCYISNLSAESATWVDQKQITQSAPVRSGSNIRFGAAGPEVAVLLVETVDSVPMEVPQQPLQNDEPAPEIPLADQPKTATARPAYIEVISEHMANVRRLELTKDVTQLGREPGLDLEFDVDACFTSRRHAEIRRGPSGYLLSDLNSFNGTLLNNRRLNGPTLLRSGDTIRLGIKGPLLRFHQRGLRLGPHAVTPEGRAMTALPTTQVQRPQPVARAEIIEEGQPIFACPLRADKTYSIGRSPQNDIRLDGLQISKEHAQLIVGRKVFVEDLDSTNGIYVNGVRVLERTVVNPNDTIQIGPFLLYIDDWLNFAVFDTRARMRLDAVALTKLVRSIGNHATIKLLDEISLTIQPNEFVGLLGPSGAGKSTFMDALSGMRPATTGQVLVNNLDLYQNLEWLKQSIGYVPQDDIIHKELTVYQTLYFVAKLRLSQDVSEAEIETIIGEVLDVTGLAARRDLQVDRLSGGQRKRVSMAVELITKPSAIFLDEPTSGLDPLTEERIMILFRQIADSGHTVILTTHAMENVSLFDKVIVLMQGKLVFYGAPLEALDYFKAKNFKELYQKMEEPTEQLGGSSTPRPNASHAPAQRATNDQENVAEIWKQKFQRTSVYDRNVQKPQLNVRRAKPGRRPPPPRRSFKYFNRQAIILCQRYAKVMRRDRTNLFLLFGQSLVIACLTWLAVPRSISRDFPYFILALVPIWFGTSVAAREIIRERAVYQRERMVNLGLWSYVVSKLIILTVIVSVQCFILFSSLKLFELLNLLKLPGLVGGVPHLGIMILTGLVGISMGLLISSLVKTSEMATSLVPLLLIPQILFSGLIGVPKDGTKLIGAVVPVTWSFDEMKRLSNHNVQVLEGKDEGAQPAFNNGGRGLYKQIQFDNVRAISNNRGLVPNALETKLKQSDQPISDPSNADARSLDSRAGEANSTAQNLSISHIPDDLSDFVGFLHPWGSIWLNPALLILMSFGLLIGTVKTLQLQELRSR